MTPAAHATAAADLLDAQVAPGDYTGAEKNARLAAVHALLAKTTGTGARYTAAENELAAAAPSTGTHANLQRAHALALLAP